MDSSQRRWYSDSAGDETTKESWFNSRQRWDIIEKAPTPPSAPTARPVHWVQRALCTRIERPGHEADPADSSYDAKNQGTCTSTPPFAVKYTFTFMFISRDVLRLPIVVLFLKDSSSLRLVSDCMSIQCRPYAVQMILPLLLVHPHGFAYICNYRAVFDTKISLVVSSVAKPPSGPKQRTYIILDFWDSFWRRTKL